MMKGGIPMKRVLALTLAGVMLFSTPVLAAEEIAALSEEVGDEGGTQTPGNTGGGSQSPSAPAVKEKPRRPRRRPVYEAPAASEAVEASSVPTAVTQAAAEQGKTVGEYMNNAVVTVPGLDYAMPIGQGGHVIINDAPSNQVFSLLKPALANVNSAKSFAAAQGGRVLTVVRVNASINGFRTARVNFYAKGVRAGQNIKVFQISNGRWLEVDVAEIREDHVVVDMTSLGTLAFIEMPSK